MNLLWTKWVLVALFTFTGFSCFHDVKKHGQPREPYNGQISAFSGVFSWLLVLWLLAVVP